MDRYWLKIGLGALAVFVLGFAGWSMIERGVTEVRDLAGSDRAISIPLFGMVPFNVEGRRSGRIDRITILRDAPKQISGVVVRVGHADSISEGAFADCSFTVQDPTHLDENTQFRCLKGEAALAGLEGFGEVRIETPGGVVVRKIFLPPEVVREFRDPAKFDAHVQAAEEHEAAAQRMADSIEAATQVMVDSIEQAVSAHVESVTAEARKRADEARARARSGGTGAPATVKVAP
ncbi:MAG TPA: hypothetical protein VLA95_04180 [Gemmatimonadales bacterium]|nr:hypothetical protein [Gemmatimonadales bacterium]